MRKWIHILLFSLLGAPFISNAQESDERSSGFLDDLIEEWLFGQQDSSFIDNLTSYVSVRLLGQLRYNYFQVRDRNSDRIIGYEPESRISAGVGLSYKWFSLDLTLQTEGIPLTDFESSKAFEFQGRIFGIKHYLELNGKYYFGFQVNRSQNLTIDLPDSLKYRPDIRNAYFGLEYMHAFQYSQFSFKAPFFYNEIQKKSAGSFLIGAGLYTFLLDGDQPILPDGALPLFSPELGFRSVFVASLNVHFGYMYSFVIGSRFYLTLGMLPGAALTAGDYQVDERELLGIRPSIHLKTMNSLGYNSRRFYTGIQFEGDIFKIVLDKKADLDVGHARSKLFIGYRFGVGKKD